MMLAKPGCLRHAVDLRPNPHSAKLSNPGIFHFFGPVFSLELIGAVANGPFSPIEEQLSEIVEFMMLHVGAHSGIAIDRALSASNKHDECRQSK
jgi:hypothetical protein